MDDDNAVLVASQWWQSQRSARVCITGIVAQIDGLGIPRPKKNYTLRELLIHFGNRLVEEKLVAFFTQRLNHIQKWPIHRRSSCLFNSN